MYRQIKELVRKDLLLEWRQKTSFYGMLLYLVSTIYLCYLIFNGIIEPNTWVALFWIIMIFSSVNAAGRSFEQETSKRYLFFYTIAKPEAIIISKLIYNTLIMSVLSLASYAMYSFFLGNEIENHPLFLITVVLGASGFSGVLTMVSAIASKTSNNATLMAILSFPVLVPLLMILVRLSRNAMNGLDWSYSWPYALALLLINLMVIGLSYILFPYLWKD